MTCSARHRLISGTLGVVCCLALPTISVAEPTTSFYSPIINVNVEKGFIVISGDGKVFAAEAGQAARPHLEKLPIGGMIDVVVELREKDVPLIKSWKVMSGESSCKIFDGTSCK